MVMGCGGTEGPIGYRNIVGGGCLGGRFRNPTKKQNLDIDPEVSTLLRSGTRRTGYVSTRALETNLDDSGFRL